MTTPDPIRTQLWLDLETVPLEESPWLAVGYSDALRAVLDLLEAEEQAHECAFPYSHTRYDLHVATFLVRKAIADSLGIILPTMESS